MKANPGDVLTFKGCMWDAQWEYDAPVVLYEPVCRYDPNGHSYPSGIADLIEDVCIDLCIDADVDPGWHPSELKEFEWRGWDPATFPARVNGWHVEQDVRFFLDADGGLAFDVVAERKRRVDDRGRVIAEAESTYRDVVGPPGDQ